MPSVALTAPANNSATNNNRPTLTVTDADHSGTGLASVQLEYSSDGGNSWLNAGPAKTSAPFSPLSFTFPSALLDGTYKARAVVTDNAGNTATSAVVTFIVDTVAPTVTMTARANNIYTSNNKPTLTATAFDNTGGSGLAGLELEYSSDGTNWNVAGGIMMGSGPSFTYTLTTALLDGHYEARAMTMDNAGNQTISAPVSFAVEPCPPPRA